jgi:amino acid adenylation domain-containing protein/non-ribosomal peptide synthase protein (TIGR01720 family)
MRKEDYISSKKVHAANLNKKERDYWLGQLSGELGKCHFPYKTNSDIIGDGGSDFLSVKFRFPGQIFSSLMKLSKGTDHTLHIILTSVLEILLYKYTDQTDIVVGTPIYRQKMEGEFLNSALALRVDLGGDITFKELLLRVKDTVLQANENQNYPLEMLLDHLGIPYSPGENFPLFDVVLLLENIHNRSYIQHLHVNMVISFLKSDREVRGILEYNLLLFQKEVAEGIAQHFTNVVNELVSNPGMKLSQVEMLSGEEKRQLLVDFNGIDRSYPNDKSIAAYVEEQVEKSPDHVAVVCEDEHLSYGHLNRRTNRLGQLLRDNGVSPEDESVVGVIMEPSLDTIVTLLAILKAGGAYLPIDPGLPRERVTFMLENAGAGVILTTGKEIERIPFTTLLNLEGGEGDPVSAPSNSLAVTPPRSHIHQFDQLPVPDRSLIHLGNYKNKIGMASVTNCISLQTTRGCPYECLFCHKIWSKVHVHRSAQNLYNEIEYYHKKGVANFAVIDDCFNLNREKSKELFQSIIKNKLKLQVFFPNGLRGDIMTPDYIDLMVEAGTRGINLSLESASPRWQKLLKKNLDLDKFKKVVDYIAQQHPGVILEMATMHGFPGETEEEAMMTLNFIKSVKWLHFPYIHILKIFPNTEMETFALEQGISREDIMRSRDRAFHELPETLPFPKSFTRKYQSDFMNNYFLNPERLKQVLPVQMNILTEEALAQKYNAYLPAEIKNIKDILEFTQLEGQIEVPGHIGPDSRDSGPALFDEKPAGFTPPPGAMKILLLDLSQHFSSHHMLYKVVEQPLGLIYLLTYLKKKFPNAIDGRIYKSGCDFDNFEELRQLVEDYQPHMIGIRTLTFFKEFFHETVSLLGQWGVKVPIITGGPYASSDYPTILKDNNVDLVVLGEGEEILEELIGNMLKTDFQLPDPEVLQEIRGIAFVQPEASVEESPDPCSRDGLDNRDLKLHVDGSHPGGGVSRVRRVMALDWLASQLTHHDPSNLEPISSGSSLAYVMYTSGSTGVPKGVMVEHRQVNNCIYWMQEKFNLADTDAIVQRTDLTFDPSVWEIFWPLYVGAGVRVLTASQRKDAQYLVRLMAENHRLTMMYCPSSIIKAMTWVLNAEPVKPQLKMPWLIIGAEPISMEVIKNFYTYFQGKIVNTYGPTECTINNTWYDLEPDDKREIVPIGKPVSNNKIYILSSALNPMPIGIPGEICIAGASVARGYIGNRAKTDAHFIHNPFGSGSMYRTGDTGRWLRDGNIEIMGRLDEQVKIRGYRIELGEIQQVLTNHSAINDCVVVAWNRSDWEREIKTCKKCGIASNYPGTVINEDSICEICIDIEKYKKTLDDYFKTPKDLETIIKEKNQDKTSRYDCLLLYSGGRGAGYALYQLKEMGFNVLAVTYNNGYFSRADLKNLRKITDSVKVDHVVLEHKNTPQILKESLKTVQTVCRGCFHTSYSLAAEYAYKDNIKVVVGATLSRGQIIENRLFFLLNQGITDVQELETAILKIQKSTPMMDKTIFNHIDIDVVQDGRIHDKVKFVDFYRYFNLTNKEMIDYLDNKDPYWKTRKNFAIYSTNCSIKQAGDYAHLKGKKYHFYGSATSWENRLGHLSLENLKQDLTCRMSAGGYESFLRRIGYQKEISLEDDGKYICAYMTQQEGKPVSAEELREYLSGKIPHYMMPSYFVLLSSIPLTPVGKVDRKALPLPDRSRSISRDLTTYTAPETKLEKIISQVWQEVLGIGKVGVKDNFFDMGGDSIKSIQISARMNKEGYRMEMRDIFMHPTIAELALIVKAVEQDRIADQAAVTGIIPLTPIQEAFFRRDRIAPHHFNQSMMLFSKERLEPEVIKAVFTRIQQHHDALRMTYRRENGAMVQRCMGLEYPLALQEYNLKHLENDNQAKDILTQKADEIQAGINLETGPIMKLGLFHLEDSDRLLIVIHHLVIDGISWRFLAEDIQDLYKQYRENRPPDQWQLPLKTDSFKTWSEKLSLYADSEEFLKEKSYWKQLESTPVPPIKKDFARGTNLVKDTDTRSTHLDERETGKLLTGVNQAFGTEINDILLTALGLALTSTFGIEPGLIALEGHGREAILTDVNINRTIGWFTTVYPVILDVSTKDLPGQVVQIKEILRQVPHKGVGYGILRYLTPGNHKKEIDYKLNPQVNFNYMGEFIAGNEGVSPLGITAESPGDMVSEIAEREYELSVSAAIVNKQLRISIAYSKNQFKIDTIDTLLNQYQRKLSEIISLCSTRQERQLTPSDFTYKGLTMEALETAASIVENEIQDIYTLSPMQEGIYFHALYDPDSAAYFEQVSYRIHGKLDPEVVERSLNELFKRYEVLRTNFIHEGFERPLQVVLKNRKVDFAYRDLNDHGFDGFAARERKEKFIREFKQNDRKRSFNLAKGALMRVSVIQVDTSEYELTWSHHHILMDGWCVGILISEFFLVYNSLVEGRAGSLPPVIPYRTYIQWLAKQDKNEAGRYWKNYLQGYEGSTSLPKMKALKPGEGKYRKEATVFLLDKKTSRRLHQLAREKQVTLNTVIQSLWAILLGEHSSRNKYKKDVVFGAVVSGRPPELEGIEKMLGLFINTIPVRIRFEKTTRFRDLLLTVKKEASQSEPFHHYPLADIQAETGLKQNLLDHIMNLENFPTAPKIDGLKEPGQEEEKPGAVGLPWGLSNADVFEQSNYDLNLPILPGQVIKVGINYNGNKFGDDFARNLETNLREIITQVLQEPDLPLGEIKITPYYYPLSAIQNRYFQLCQKGVDRSHYTNRGVYIWESEPDRQKLERAFSRLIQRHESLRISLGMKANEPVQQVHDEVEFEIEYIRYSEPSEGPGNDEMNALHRYNPSFDLSRAPLCKAALIQAGENRHILVVDTHQMIADTRSMELLIEELMALYAGQELSPLSFRYKDYLEKQNSKEQEGLLREQEQEKYWMEVFSGNIQPLRLPTDHPRERASLPFKPGKIRFSAAEELTGGLKKMAAARGVTLYMVLMAAYNILLSKYCCREDIIIRTIVPGMTDHNLEKIIGPFIEPLTLRNFPQANQPFVDFLEKVKENVDRALENRDYPFEKILAKLNREMETGWFDIFFQVIPGPESRTAIDRETTRYELSLTARPGEDNLVFCLEYARELYEEATMRNLGEHYLEILEIVSGDETIPMIDIDLTAGDENLEDSQVDNVLKVVSEFDF